VYLGSAVRNRHARDVVPAARFAVRAVLPLRPPSRPGAAATIDEPAWLRLYR
jgi:hypothetical protein